MKMNYIKFGNGLKNLIIVPGLSLKPLCGLKDAIEKQFLKLTSIYTIYLFDRRTDVLGPYTIKDMADDLYIKLNELGISYADFYGTSQGGMIVEEFVLKYPLMVGKIVLASTLSRINPHFENVYENWISLAIANNIKGLVTDVIEHVYGKNTLGLYGEYLINSNLDLTDIDLSNFIVNAKAFRGFDCFDNLSKIKNKVLLMGSTSDIVTTVEGSMEIINKLKCDSFIYTGDYGHAVYDEAIDFIDKIYEFLTK